MSESPRNGSSGDLAPEILPWALLLAIGLMWRLYLIYAFPQMYSWDAFTRLWEREHLLVRHWLPAPQLPIYLWAHLELGFYPLRAVYAVIGAAAATLLGFYTYGLTDDRVVGLSAGALITFLPVLTTFTIVPYQEGLFLLGIAAGFMFWTKQSLNLTPAFGWIASIGLAVAVLSRFEAWFVVALLGVSAAIRHRFSDIKYLLLPTAIALLWVGTVRIRPAHDGFGRAEDTFRTDALETSVFQLLGEALPALTLVLLGTAQFITLIIALPAIWGVWQVLRSPRWSHCREWLIFWGLLILLAVGRILNADVLTERMLLLPAVGAVPIAAIGIADLLARVRHRLSGPTLRTAFLLPIVVFIPVGSAMVEANALRFDPEVRAAAMLESVPRSARVEVWPRPLNDPFGESAVNAIFGNSPTLDPKSGRWSFGTQTGLGPDPALTLRWTGTEYELLSIPLDGSTGLSEALELTVQEICQEAKREQLNPGYEQDYRNNPERLSHHGAISDEQEAEQHEGEAKREEEAERREKETCAQNEHEELVGVVDRPNLGATRPLSVCDRHVFDGAPIAQERHCHSAREGKAIGKKGQKLDHCCAAEDPKSRVQVDDLVARKPTGKATEQPLCRPTCERDLCTRLGPSGDDHVQPGGTTFPEIGKPFQRICTVGIGDCNPIPVCDFDAGFQGSAIPPVASMPGYCEVGPKLRQEFQSTIGGPIVDHNNLGLHRQFTGSRKHSIDCLGDALDLIVGRDQDAKY